LDVNVDIIEHKQSCDRVIDIAHALGMPETTIHSVLKNAKDYEAKAVTMQRHSEVKLT
jgi:fructose-specific component phosphotransferase system IIB-like protein